MENEVSVNELQSLVELSYQYGPFFFSLLFILWVSRWGYRKYTEACVRQDPVASPGEIKTKKHYFLVTLYVGVVLVGVSVVWWFLFKPSVYVFAGKIESLKEYHDTVSPTLFLRSEYQQSGEHDIPLPHQEHFVITRNTPFQYGEAFDVSVIDTSAVGDARIKAFEIRYEGSDYLRLKFDADDMTGDAILKPVKIIGVFRDEMSLIKPAYAEWSAYRQLEEVRPEVEQYYRHKIRPLTASVRDEPSRIDIPMLSMDDAISSLQNERTPVSVKIAAISTVLNADSDALKNLLNYYLSPEPLLQTLSDLTRHTDKVLAGKAKIIWKKIDPLHFVSNAHDNALLEREVLEELILRFGEKDGLKLLEALVQNETVDWAFELQEGVNNRTRRFEGLIPTGTLGGDRYYVKAEWVAGEQPITDCLTQLFNQALINDRSMDDERRIMKNRSERYIYWYDKKWAINISAAIRACGAEASYIGF